uniref:Secreted protein n=1 Tax=Rhipicephalus appendiculatus TaxID=34631 RepID=A0A131YAE7_RHIAP
MEHTHQMEGCKLVLIAWSALLHADCLVHFKFCHYSHGDTDDGVGKNDLLMCQYNTCCCLRQKLTNPDKISMKHQQQESRQWCPHH